MRGASSFPAESNGKLRFPGIQTPYFKGGRAGLWARQPPPPDVMDGRASLPLRGRYRHWSINYAGRLTQNSLPVRQWVLAARSEFDREQTPFPQFPSTVRIVSYLAKEIEGRKTDSWKNVREVGESLYGLPDEATRPQLTA